jgi:hypothetical protein
MVPALGCRQAVQDLATLELKEDDLADIAAAVHATGAGTGPASPPFAAPRRQ